MEFNKEFTAGIIIIGNEILSGRTVDKNTSFIAMWLGDRGISVEEAEKWLGPSLSYSPKKAA